MLHRFSHPYHAPGTLSANLSIRFTVPSDCTLLKASAHAFNDSDATLDPWGFLQPQGSGSQTQTA